MGVDVDMKDMISLPGLIVILNRFNAIKKF